MSGTYSLTITTAEAEAALRRVHAAARAGGLTEGEAREFMARWAVFVDQRERQYRLLLEFVETPDGFALRPNAWLAALAARVEGRADA